MKKQFLLLTLITLVLFSCQKEDDVPSIFLEGTYQSELEFTEGNPVYSSKMIFTGSGNVRIEHFVIPIDSQESCLRGYSEGTYVLQGEKFILSLSTSFGQDPAAFDISGGCVPKEQLVNNLNPTNRTQTGILVLDNENDSFLFSYTCNDVLGYMINCVGPQTYTKVD